MEKVLSTHGRDQRAPSGPYTDGPLASERGQGGQGGQGRRAPRTGWRSTTCGSRLAERAGSYGRRDSGRGSGGNGGLSPVENEGPLARLPFRAGFYEHELHYPGPLLGVGCWLVACAKQETLGVPENGF